MNLSLPEMVFRLNELPDEVKKGWRASGHTSLIFASREEISDFLAEDLIPLQHIYIFEDGICVLAFPERFLEDLDDHICSATDAALTRLRQNRRLN